MGTASINSEVGICNQALARMGSTQMITSFNDQSNEAAQCAVFYPSDRDAMLSDFPWPWAEGYSNLVQVAGPETTGKRANAQWLRSYRYPVDCLKMRRVVMTPAPINAIIPQTSGPLSYGYSGNEPWRRAVGDTQPISYGLGNDISGELIMSDFFGPYGLTAIYTNDMTDVNQFSADFIDCLAWRVASDLAMGLGFDTAKREYADKQYNETIRKIRATHYNEMASDIPLIRRQSQVIRARWGCG